MSLPCTNVAKDGVAVVAGPHEVHLVITRRVALRTGRLVAHTPPASLDACAIEPIGPPEGSARS